MALIIVIAIPFASVYYLVQGNIGAAIIFGLLTIPICKFLFGGHPDTKKVKTKKAMHNSSGEKMVLMKYLGYETYTTVFGNKKRRRVWKTKWVSEEEYRARKHRPYVTRPWEARFFD